jgi:hypothetical protein
MAESGTTGTSVLRVGGGRITLRPLELTRLTDMPAIFPSLPEALTIR